MRMGFTGMKQLVVRLAQSVLGFAVPLANEQERSKIKGANQRGHPSMRPSESTLAPLALGPPDGYELSKEAAFRDSVNA
jgi:hypothetical protein